MASRINRRTICLMAGAAALAREVRAGVPNGKPPAAARVLVPLRLDQPLPVGTASDGVRWRENTYHLVRVYQARFHLDEHSRLTATVSASLTTFDKVDYDLHAAVFDPAGRLLGTARAVVPVERIWLGKVLTSRTSVPLDFGLSEAYPDATSFTLTLSRRKVLTPVDWQR
jgi:hypothetical protein